MGFVMLDVAILSSCILGGIIGAAADYCMKRADFVNISLRSSDESTNIHSWDRYVAFIFGRLFLGAISGLVVWLLLTGSLAEGKAPLTKLFLFCIVAGFSGPAIANRYKEQIIDWISGKIKKP